MVSDVRDLSDDEKYFADLYRNGYNYRKKILEIVEYSDFDTEYDIGDGITVMFKRPEDADE